MALFSRVFEYLDLVPEVPAPEHPVPLDQDSGGLPDQPVALDRRLQVRLPSGGLVGRRHPAQRGREGGRQQHGDAGGRAEAGEHADDGAEEGTKQADQQIGGRSGDGKTVHQMGNDFHDSPQKWFEPEADRQRNIEYAVEQQEHADGVPVQRTAGAFGGQDGGG